MPNEKVDRNKRLYQYRLAHPDMTITAIGKVFRIESEVAWRIIKRMEAKAQSDSEAAK